MPADKRSCINHDVATADTGVATPGGSAECPAARDAKGKTRRGHARETSDHDMWRLSVAYKLTLLDQLRRRYRSPSGADTPDDLPSHAKTPGDPLPSSHAKTTGEPLPLPYQDDR